VRTLFVSSEIYPLAKTGGLADVSAALPAALAGQCTDMRLLLPSYVPALDQARLTGRDVDLGEILGFGPVRLLGARTPDSDLPLWLVDCPALFRRDGTPYQQANGADWPDNHLRFALFAHAAARLALDRAGQDWRPDVLHLNDWQTGLVPAILAAQARPRPRTLLTIHNVAFQGDFPGGVFPRLGLAPWLYSPDGIEFYGQVSFLKAGIRFADKLTTVSPTYAREILTPKRGCGLDGVLGTRARDLVGILNGVDYSVWSPTHGLNLAARFGPQDLVGKEACKASLQRELGLETSERAPLLVFVNRLTEQKMADVLPDAVASICRRGGQLAVLGRGDPGIEARVRAMGREQPGRVAVRIGYDEPSARRMKAGGDFSLVPSRFEPCGLTQLYAMRYGAVPIVSRVGGLSDTVVDTDDTTVSTDTATGVVFDAVDLSGLLGAIDRAFALFESDETLRQVRRRGMTVDFGWSRSAVRYRELYELLAGTSDRAPEGRAPSIADAAA